MPRGPAIAPKLLAYLGKHIGVHVSVQDIAETIGETPSRVSHGMGYLARNPEYGVRRVTAGIFVYSPPAAPKSEDNGFKPGDLMEVVGRTSGGRWVIRRDDGTLYAIADRL